MIKSNMAPCSRKPRYDQNVTYGLELHYQVLLNMTHVSRTRNYLNLQKKVMSDNGSQLQDDIDKSYSSTLLCLKGTILT